VAESTRLYGRRFWPSLSLGLTVAVLNQLSAGHPRDVQVVLLALATPFFTASYIAATRLVADKPLHRSRVPLALAAGVLAFLPVPALVLLYVLPALAWLALVGLVVPVALLEDGSLGQVFRRAARLGRADYVHALGSLAALVIVFAVTRIMLILLLHGQADTTVRVAGFLADVVVSPLIFLGSALLYFDQAARLVSSRSGPRNRRSDADLHHADHVDRPGRADAQVQPGAAARGES